jgi:hypothetical protein
MMLVLFVPTYVSRDETFPETMGTPGRISYKHPMQVMVEVGP